MKYRIKKTEYGQERPYFTPQVKHWWMPFWLNLGVLYRSEFEDMPLTMAYHWNSIDDAQRAILLYKKHKNAIMQVEVVNEK